MLWWEVDAATFKVATNVHLIIVEYLLKMTVYLHGLCKFQQQVLDHGSEPLLEPNLGARITKESSTICSVICRAQQGGETLAYANKIQTLLMCRSSWISKMVKSVAGIHKA